MIYFLLDPAACAVKIGYSASPEDRPATLQTGNPTRLIPLGSIHGERDREQELHAKFKRLRLEGEWFEFKEDLPEVVDALLQTCGRLVKGVEIVAYKAFTGMIRDKGRDCFSLQANGKSAMECVENQAFWVWRVAGMEGLERVFDAVEAFAVRHCPDDANHIMHCLDHRFDGIGDWYA